MPESYRSHEYPDNIEEHFEQCKELSLKLKNNIDSENFELFEEYIYHSGYVQREENCYAFSCGMKFVIQAIIGVLFRE